MHQTFLATALFVLMGCATPQFAARAQDQNAEPTLLRSMHTNGKVSGNPAVEVTLVYNVGSVTAVLVEGVFTAAEAKNIAMPHMHATTANEVRRYLDQMCHALQQSGVAYTPCTTYIWVVTADGALELFLLHGPDMTIPPQPTSKGGVMLMLDH